MPYPLMTWRLCQLEHQHIWCWSKSSGIFKPLEGFNKFVCECVSNHRNISWFRMGITYFRKCSNAKMLLISSYRTLNWLLFKHLIHEMLSTRNENLFRFHAILGFDIDPLQNNHFVIWIAAVCLKNWRNVLIDLSYLCSPILVDYLRHLLYNDQHLYDKANDTCFCKFNKYTFILYIHVFD